MIVLLVEKLGLQLIQITKSEIYINNINNIIYI